MTLIGTYAEELKFANCLPPEQLRSCVSARLFDREGAAKVLGKAPAILRGGP